MELHKARALTGSDWRLVEKVAALLEKALRPDATVEIGRHLPVLGKPSRKPRQCDVVVTYGAPPRETIAIVEVQKRTRRPDITTFHGWRKKMEEVGAQHLLCVSVRGFPDSIVLEAQAAGPTVRLLTLEELEVPSIPGITFLPLMDRTPQYTVEAAGPLSVKKGESTPTAEDLEIRDTDKVFALGGCPDALSIRDLINRGLPNGATPLFRARGLREPDSYKLNLVFGSVQMDLWIMASGQRYKVERLPVSVRVQITPTRIPLSCFVYRQEDDGGALAWTAIAQGDVQGREVVVQMVFVPDHRGFLQLAETHMQGAESLEFHFDRDEGVLLEEIGIARDRPSELGPAPV